MQAWHVTFLAQQDFDFSWENLIYPAVVLVLWALKGLGDWLAGKAGRKTEVADDKATPRPPARPVARPDRATAPVSRPATPVVRPIAPVVPTVELPARQVRRVPIQTVQPPRAALTPPVPPDAPWLKRSKEPQTADTQSPMKTTRLLHPSMDRASLRTAIILNEIIAPPLALRPPEPSNVYVAA